MTESGASPQVLKLSETGKSQKNPRESTKRPAEISTEIEYGAQANSTILGTILAEIKQHNQSHSVSQFCEKEDREYLLTNNNMRQTLDTFDRGYPGTLDVTNFATNFQTNINNWNTNPTTKEFPKKSDRDDVDFLECPPVETNRLGSEDVLPAVINIPVPNPQTQRTLVNASNTKKSSLRKVNAKNGNGEVFLEKRYCSICNLDQPIRSKHCKSCMRCVATFDHHCPWIGKSIN